MSKELGVPLPEPGETRRLNKRCSNARLRRSGYQLRYPSFREGYPDIVREFVSRSAE
jgi:hypothetical protein